MAGWLDPVALARSTCVMSLRRRAISTSLPHARLMLSATGLFTGLTIIALRLTVKRLLHSWGGYPQTDQVAEAERPRPGNKAIGAAIRQAYKGAGITQDELASRLGGTTNQGMVSRWARGAVEPDLEMIAAIERACDAPRGLVLRLAGYVDEAVTVALAVKADPVLTERSKREVQSYYEFVRQRDETSTR